MKKASPVSSRSSTAPRSSRRCAVAEYAPWRPCDDVGERRIAVWSRSVDGSGWRASRRSHFSHYDAGRSLTVQLYECPPIWSVTMALNQGDQSVCRGESTGAVAVSVLLQTPALVTTATAAQDGAAVEEALGLHRATRRVIQ